LFSSQVDSYYLSPRPYWGRGCKKLGSRCTLMNVYQEKAGSGICSIFPGKSVSFICSKYPLFSSYYWAIFVENNVLYVASS